MSDLRCHGCGDPLTYAGFGREPKWCSERCRKAQYGGTCEECGGPTYGGDGREKAPTHCRLCIDWTPEDALAAIRRFAERHGTAPRQHQTGVANDLPPHATLRRIFGSFDAAIRTAGYRPAIDRRPETWEYILAEVRAGRRVEELAAELGVSYQAIHERFRNRGLRLGDFRPGRDRMAA